MTVKLVAVPPPTDTLFTFGEPAVPKPEPVTATVSPPAVEPDVGARLVTVGGAKDAPYVHR
jgi:hypothetical protein